MFGWIKTTGGIAPVKARGLAKVQAVFTLVILERISVDLNRAPESVIAGLDPAIHAARSAARIYWELRMRRVGMDTRVKPAYDELVNFERIIR